MLLLDTHVWHWWLNQIPDRLPKSIVDRIESAESLAVSAISCFEMAWLVKHGRVDLGMPFEAWLPYSEKRLSIIPVDEWIAARAVQLHEHHKDPMDRIIIATAIENQARLVSFDAAFAAYGELAGLLIGRDRW